MKNLIVLFTLLALIGLSSCKQNWTCQCVDNNNTTLTTTQINGGTFLHAKHTCYSMSGKCSLLTDAR